MTPGECGRDSGGTQRGRWGLTGVDDHVPAQVGSQIKPLPAAGLGALLGPALAVHQVDVVLGGREMRGAAGDPREHRGERVTPGGPHLEAAESDVDLPTACVGAGDRLRELLRVRVGGTTPPALPPPAQGGATTRPGVNPPTKVATRREQQVFGGLVPTLFDGLEDS